MGSPYIKTYENGHLRCRRCESLCELVRLRMEDSDPNGDPKNDLCWWICPSCGWGEDVHQNCSDRIEGEG
jgi:hypothetical protein